MFGSIRCANLEVPEIFGSARRHEEYRQRRLRSARFSVRCLDLRVDRCRPF